MALTLGDNFSYQGAKPLDARLKYATLTEMKAVGDATMYDGCMAYCSGTDKTYQWKSTNSVDASTGRWREFSSGGGSYTAGEGIDITNDVISTKQSEEGDIDEIIDVYPQAGELVSIVNAFNRGDLYSTDEKMIGQWYDGKPLYQKTLTGTISVDTDKTSKNTTIGNISEDLDVVVSIDGIREHENKSVFVSLSVSSALTNNSVYVCNLFVNNSTGNLVLEDNRLADDGRIVYATVKYTKTTDTAISIGSTTEYSTDEKVVGTWLDGKPIWQKTIITTFGEINVAKEIELDISAETIVSMDGMYSSIPTTATYWNPFNSFSSNMQYANKIWISTGQQTKLFVYTSHSDRVGENVVVTIRYTKTTS